MRDKNLSVECSVLESAPKQSEIEVTVRCENECYDVCVGALSVNFTMLNFMWFVSHFTVDVTRLLLSSRFSLLVINLLTIFFNARYLCNASNTSKTALEQTPHPTRGMLRLSEFISKYLGTTFKPTPVTVTNLSQQKSDTSKPFTNISIFLFCIIFI